MSALAGAERGPVAGSALILVALTSLALSIVAGLPMVDVSLAAILVGLLAVSHRIVFQWHNLLACLIFVILFIPIRRYTLPGDLPFQLEPYRVVVALLIVFWMTSLLIDPRVRLRKSGLEGPIAVIIAAALGSVVFSTERISALRVEGEVNKAVIFLASFILVFFFVVSVIRTIDHVRALVKLLVAGGAVVAVLAILESRTGYNVFAELHRVVPFLELNFVLEIPSRGRFRAIGPAEHAIALSAALAMLIPLGVYLAVATGKRRWIVLTGVIAVGVTATVSRTGIVMLGVAVLVFLWLRPRETKRFWPALVPLVVLVHFALPGTLGTLKYSFFPAGGLVEEQRGFKDSGRVGDLDPTLAQVWETPLLGQGLGSRIVRYNPKTNQRANARILDDQWLATLLETGAVGFAGWLWFFARLIKRLGRAAKRDASERGWLLVALCASLTAYAVGMLTYDAFSFIQVSFLMYIFAALGMGLVAGHVRPAPTRHAASRVAHAYGGS